MRTTITTKSGSVYRISQGEDERTYISRNFREVGLLAQAVKITPGKRMEIVYYPMEFSGGRICGNARCFLTTPVESVVID